MGNGRVTNNDLQEEQECLCSGKWRYSRTFPPKELPQGQEMRRLSLCAAVSGCAHSACLPRWRGGQEQTACPWNLSSTTLKSCVVLSLPNHSKILSSITRGMCFVE